jgi:hypothetical protein
VQFPLQDISFRVSIFELSLKLLQMPLCEWLTVVLKPVQRHAGVSRDDCQPANCHGVQPSLSGNRVTLFDGEGAQLAKDLASLADGTEALAAGQADVDRLVEVECHGQLTS